MNNGQMDRGNENPTQHLPLMIEENHEKTSVKLVGTGIWTRDLPNASLMRYHGATSLGNSPIASQFDCIIHSEDGRPYLFPIQQFILGSCLSTNSPFHLYGSRAQDWNSFYLKLFVIWYPECGMKSLLYGMSKLLNLQFHWKFSFQKKAICWLDVEFKGKNSIVDWDLNPGL